MKSRERLGPAQRGQPGARHRGHGALLPDEAARQRSDDDGFAVRIGLGMCCGSYAGRVARELNRHVLKSPTGAEHGHALLAGEADGGVNGVVVAVGRARQRPETVEAVDSTRLAAVGGHPAQIDPVGYETHGRFNLAMCDVLEIPVPEGGDRRGPFSDSKHLPRTLDRES